MYYTKNVICLCDTTFIRVCSIYLTVSASSEGVNPGKCRQMKIRAKFVVKNKWTVKQTDFSIIKPSISVCTFL